MDLINLKRQLEQSWAQVALAVSKQSENTTPCADGTKKFGFFLRSVEKTELHPQDRASLQLQVEEVFKSLEGLQSSLPPLDSAVERVHCQHDNRVHNPLGAGSYIYEKNYVPSLFRYLGPDVDHRPTLVVIHIGAQPNNSLHVGTMVVFSLAFLIGREMLRYYRSQRDKGKWQHDLQVRVQLDLVDTAPDNKQGCVRDGVTYQRSQRNTQAMKQFLPDYEFIVHALFEFVGGEVPYTVENQETLMGMWCMPNIVSAIAKDQERLGRELSPQWGKLAIRCACPEPGCGYAEKHGRANVYSTAQNGETTITFRCPDHGSHSVSLSDPEDVKRLEFNTPLRNLVRAFAYGEDTALSQTSATTQRVHMRVTGADYAGMYQEQLLWRQLAILSQKTQPLIVYAPLIVDWAGSKLSKSLYVEPGAYRYLKDQNMDYLLSFQRMKECNRDVTILFREVETWVQEPKKLFRSFSIEYLHRVFEKNAS